MFVPVRAAPISLGPVPWASWDEQDGATLLADDNYFKLVPSPVDTTGSDQQGEGWGLSAAQTLFTDHNSKIGPWNSLHKGRALDYLASRQGFFDVPHDWIMALTGYSVWSMILKVTDGDWAAGNTGPWCITKNSPSPDALHFQQNGGLAARMMVNGTDGGWKTIHNSDAPDYFNTYSGAVYFCMWSDATGVWAGYKKDTKPTSAADVTWKMQFLSSPVAWGSGTSTYCRCLCNGYHQGYNYGMDGYFNYFVASRGVTLF